MAKIIQGDVVRLKANTTSVCKSELKKVAVVEVMLQDIKGGVKLSEAIGGFRYWNVEDLEKIAS
jgi:hypothetical protein